MDPSKLTGLSDSEKAYFTSGGAVDPVTGKAAEETTDVQSADVGPVHPGHEQGDAGADSKEASAGETAAAREAEEADDTDTNDESDEDVVEVADGTNPDGTGRRKVIAFGAYDKQRVAAQKAKAELEQTRQQLAYLTGLVQQRQGGPQAPVQAAQQQGPHQPVAAPDPQKEPQKWLEWVNSTLTAAQQAQVQQQQQSAQQQQVNQLNAAAYQAEQEFVNGDGGETQPHPDYYEAIKFLDGARRNELKLAGYEPEVVQQIIEAQNKDIAMRALNRGDNAASKFYALAKSRGFKAPAAPSQAAPSQAARNAAGQFTKTEAEKVADQAKKQATNKSIAGLAGAGTGELSLESLANTPTDEFAKMFKEGKVQKMLGIPV